MFLLWLNRFLHWRLKKRLKDKEAISSETINKLKKDIEKQKEEQKKLMDETRRGQVDAVSWKEGSSEEEGTKEWACLL